MDNPTVKPAKTQKITLLILGLLAAIGPFSIDMYLPAFHTIAVDFNSSVEQVQLSLTSFFVGIAFGQLVYGPLLDRYGRKKPLLVGLFIYCVTCILCLFTQNIEHLIALRFLQALGSCAGMVVSRAMVQDLYEPREAARVFSLLMLVIAISPILAPSAGALLLNHMDWHYIFVFLFAIALMIMMATLLFLPESYAGSKSFSLKPKAIIGNYWEVFKTPLFNAYTFIGAIAASGLYGYLAGSSFVMQQYFGLNQSQYGLAFAFVASAMIAATQINRRLLKRWSSSQISLAANVWQSCVGLCMVLALWADILSLPLMLGLIFFYLFGHGFIFPNTSAIALSPFRALAGTASALLGCMQMAVGALASALVSYFHDDSPAPLLVIMCGCAFLSLIIHLMTRKTITSDL